MKAMVLAAGLGTRLRPLTNTQPKAMVEVAGKPLLEHTIQRLIRFGYTEIIVNVHHFADQIIDFLQKKQNFGIRIEISDERERLLDTGGALWKARWFLEGEEPFLLCNTDILTSLDLHQFRAHHIQKGGVVTLATRKRSTSRYLIFDQEDQLHGWTNIKTGELKLARLEQNHLELRGFSGYHFIEPSLLAELPQEEAFSIIPFYLDAAKKHALYSYPHDSDIWIDVGKPEELAKGAEFLAQIHESNKGIS